MATSHSTGQRISYDGALCTVRYIGEVAGANGSWLGVEWDDSTRGKHDGSHKGVRYFSCLSKSPTAASFVRPTRPADSPQSFLSALKSKYVEAVDNGPDGVKANQIVISGKVAEEMGFDKIRQQISQLEELKIVLLDGLRVSEVPDDSDDTIAETCPEIAHLDVSRNLFQTLQPIVDICKQLPVLKKLAINANRFQDVSNDPALESAQDAFANVADLGLGHTLLSWEEICHIGSKFPSLDTLAIGTNQLSSLSGVNLASMFSSLTTINLEFNEFRSLSDVASLAELKSLRNLHLKGNNVSSLATAGESAPIFSDELKYLDISYNTVAHWVFLDCLTTSFPGLTGLRISHNPIYEQPTASEAATSEEAYMYTVARIGQLVTLNFSKITDTDRSNAEIFYLSRIAKQMASVAEGQEKTVTDTHPRYGELCRVYGEPDIIRREEVNPAFLEARLVNVTFHLDGEEKTSRIPKSFDIYAVKGIAGKLYGVAPLSLTMIWETGEWDPAAGLYDDDADSSDDDDELEETAHVAEAERTGRWVKREIELRDGPRQLGYCIEGTDIRCRLERRK